MVADNATLNIKLVQLRALERGVAKAKSEGRNDEWMALRASHKRLNEEVQLIIIARQPKGRRK